MTQRDKVAVNSRIFCLAAILGLALVTRSPGAMQVVLAVAVVAALSSYVLWVSEAATLVTLTAECLLVGLIMGLTFPQSLVLLPYLAVLPLLGGLSNGWVGVGFTILAQSLALFLLPLATDGFADADARLTELAPWLLTNIGAGLIGIWAQKLGLSALETTTDTSYESARQLLTQLRTVTRRLSAGLDVEAMAAQLLVTINEQLGDDNAVVFVNSGGGTLVPLAYRGPDAQRLFTGQDYLVDQCWAEMEPVHGTVPSGRNTGRHRVVLPLRVGRRMIGVAVSSAAQPTDPDDVTALMPEIDSQSLRLDTALVFEEIRTMATADERQRLAREIHDGIAQEIASIGYVVDHLAATSSDAKQTAGLRDLRTELTRVVGDLRLSIFDLRSDVTSSVSLGAALSDYVRQVGTKSGLAVHLSLKEAPTRLAPVVESELFRIAQEAITNARKHAQARNLWVECWTEPPAAEMTIRDDGVGLGTGRDDSFGMSVMRERAQRIDALLDISNAENGTSPAGTVVTVKVASKRPALSEG